MYAPVAALTEIDSTLLRREPAKVSAGDVRTPIQRALPNESCHFGTVPSRSLEGIYCSFFSEARSADLWMAAKERGEPAGV